MAHYLSPEWFDEMTAISSATPIDGIPIDAVAGSGVTLREVVTGSPFGDVSWVVKVRRDGIVLSRDAEERADVVLTQDYATAVGLHTGELTTQEAFFAGRVRVSGNLSTLLANAEVLQGLGPIFEPVRATTTYA